MRHQIAMTRSILAWRLDVAAHLRVFSDAEPASPAYQAPNVRITLGELLPLLAIAQRRNYHWLNDFLDDEVKITADLYDILRAFRASRPSA
jgi:hypothetical protein